MAIIAGNVVHREQFADLFTSRLPYIDDILINRFNDVPVIYPQLFKVLDSDRMFEEVTGITGLGLFGKKSEGDTIVYDKPLQGFDKRYEHDTYAKGTQITREAMQDDIDNAISDLTPLLARSARNSIETEAASDFNLGFTTVTTPDGLSFFNTAHVLVGGGTFSNRVTGDLSQSTLEEAANLFDNQVDDRNQFLDFAAQVLLYPPKLRWLVHELLKSQQRPDSNINAANALEQLNISPIMWRYITNVTDWFVGAGPSDHELRFYWKENPVTDHSLDFDSGNMKSKMTMRFSHGPADPRGWIGGDGT